MDAHMMRAVKELSDLMNCQLDSETLKVLVELCELGIDPTSLARVVIELREEQAKLEAKQRKSRGRNPVELH